ncbi:NADH-quinone oxidoreductase subunit NuoE [Desulfobacterales bacterium HSG17]|nr:NADH-quinone oxidoreductase subunit NuoE [Desulfobacterales bacterium HSG17]
MLPKVLKESLQNKFKHTDHPKELVVDVMMAVQEHYGYLSDEALEESAKLLNLNPMELEEIATFYTFIYREPVGKYVIHVCDSVVCWMDGSESIQDYLCRILEIKLGQTTKDGLFTLLPVCCIGYCDRSPAILINKKVYGHLTSEKLDNILEKLKKEAG